MKVLTRRPGIALALIVFVAAALRLVGLGDQPFWLDEAHTAEFTTLSLGDLWSFRRPFDTVNPPGFILLMKIWTQVSRSDEWFRLLSALAGIATVPVVYAVGARMGSRRVGFFAAAFVAVSGFHVRYSQEARAYALITLLATIALWSVTQLVTEPDGDSAHPIRTKPRPTRIAGQGLRRPLTWTDVAWFSYGVSVGLALHLHNTAIGIALASNLAIGIWWLSTTPKPPRFARNWIGANLLAVLVWSPWLPGFFTQLGLVQANFWVLAPSLATVTRDMGVLFDAYVASLIPSAGDQWFHALVLVLVLTTMLWVTRTLDKRYRLIIWSFVLVQPLFELLFSLRQPVFLSRTLLWIVPGFGLALGLAVKRPIRIAPALVAIFVLLVGAVGALGYHRNFQKTAWDQAAEIVADQGEPDDIVLVLAGNTLVAFDRYFESQSLDIPRYSLPWRIPGRTSSGATLTVDDIDRIVALAQPHRRTWLVLNSVANIENGDTLAPALAERLTLVEDYNLPDVAVFAYE